MTAQGSAYNNVTSKFYYLKKKKKWPSIQEKSVDLSLPDVSTAQDPGPSFFPGESPPFFSAVSWGCLTA